MVKWSLNSLFLDEQAFKAIEQENNVATSYVRLQDALILSCTGCETCMTKHIMGDSGCPLRC